MAIGSLFAHTNKRYITSIILCPGHLVNKWKRETERLYPMSRSIICTGLDMFISDIQPLLDNPNRRENLFIIMSKETAKGNYELVPAPVIKQVKDGQQIRPQFHCPHCGNKLTQSIFVFRTRKMTGKYAHDKYISSTNNGICPICKEPLWQPSRGKDNAWIKFTNFGWLPKCIIEPLITGGTFFVRNLTKKEQQALDVGLRQYQDAPETILETKSKKCSLAKYIYQRYKNKIDYLIADEIHQYAAANSQQGKMLSTLVRTAKHTLGLTGTLMNGYAENLFYLLFRICPRMMIRAGYDYKSSAEFSAKFGVHRVDMIQTGSGTYSNRQRRKEKQLPGVSPLVFTDFLLDSCVFVSLEDMSDNLPSYTEIPYGVDLEDDVAVQYEHIQTNVREILQQQVEDYKERQRMLISIVQLMSIYPDQPYDIAPLYDYSKNEVAAEIPDVDMSNDRILNKEAETLRIAKQAVDRGEHVLIYYQWTNKTDIAERLCNLCEDSGMKTAILTANVAAKKREQWIQDKVKEGVKVLICNPALVETGLDLLDFTTIIFYQVGYKLVTMRQASKRSRRLNQTHPVTVYFMYYRHTMQQQALAIMAAKLHAAVALEGKFNEQGLAAMDSTTDILSQLAQTIVDDNEYNVDTKTFEISEEDNNLEHRFQTSASEEVMNPLKARSIFVSGDNSKKRKKKKNKLQRLPMQSVCNW